MDSRYCKGVRVVQPVKRSVTVVEVEKVLVITAIIDDGDCDTDGDEAVVEAIVIPPFAIEGIIDEGIGTLIDSGKMVVGLRTHWCEYSSKMARNGIF